MCNDDSECSICLDKLRQNTVQTTCGHTFHRRCLTSAIMRKPHCPYCRQKFRIEWMNKMKLVNMSAIGLILKQTPDALVHESARHEYWDSVEDSFEEPPLVGPMLPCHQRWYNMDILEETSTRPLPWSTIWIQDRMVEMRIRFAIPSDIKLTAFDVHCCEINGILGVYPEWMPQC